MTVGAVIWPDFETRKAVDDYRRQYDPHFHLIDPHITVIFPVDAPLPLSEVATRVREAVLGLQAFHVTLAKLSGINQLAADFPEATRTLLQYPNAKNAIFLLTTEGSDQIVELKTRIGSPVGMPACLATYPPYLTLGQTLSDAQYSQAMGHLSPLDFCHRFRVRTFDLLTAKADGRWDTVETIALTGR